MAKVKLTIEIPDSVFQTMVDWMENYEDLTVTVEEMKGNQKVLDFLTTEIPAFYDLCGDQGLENMDLAEALGYEPAEEDDDFDGVTITVTGKGDDDWDWSVGYGPEDAPLPGETPEQTSKRIGKRDADRMEEWRKKRQQERDDD